MRLPSTENAILKTRIAIGACDTYDTARIKGLLLKALEDVQFSFHGRGTRALIKPNLLSAKSPEKAVTTHPAIIRAIGELLKDHSYAISIGDSPGFGSTTRVLAQSGIMDVVNHLGLTVSSFDSKIIKKNIGISPYREFLFGDDPDAYDLVINVPKLKSHAMMGVTLGVKNTFGFIHAFEKAKWHLRAGHDRLLFASMLIDIHRIAKPDLTILDGIVGMDRDGPSSGRIRDLGLVAVGTDAFALDDSIERMLHLPHPAPVTHVARKHGLVPDHEIVKLGEVSVTDFQLPRTTMDTDWDIPNFAKHLLKNTVLHKPKVQEKICKGCGVCVRVCPNQALTLSEGKPVFDYVRCIRCYCCHELCPANAIKI